jgi:DNA-binding CsgD family transcriptional regulator
MSAERIGMRDAREIIRLKFSGLSTHEIARRLGMARSTVRETLKRADKNPAGRRTARALARPD